jgi:hypothetical protein
MKISVLKNEIRIHEEGLFPTCAHGHNGLARCHFQVTSCYRNIMINVRLGLTGWSPNFRRPRKEKGDETSSILNPRYSSCLFANDSFREQSLFQSKIFLHFVRFSRQKKRHLCSLNTSVIACILRRKGETNYNFCLLRRENATLSATNSIHRSTATIQICSAYIFVHVDILDSGEKIMRI